MPNKASIAHWGPAGWDFIHAVSFAYSKTPTSTERDDMHKFVSACAKVLPCKICCRHFQNFIASDMKFSESSRALVSRDALSRFLVDAHNDVNLRLGKRRLSYDEVARQYSPGGGGMLDSNWIFLVVVGVLCVLILRARHRH